MEASSAGFAARCFKVTVVVGFAALRACVAGISRPFRLTIEAYDLPKYKYSVYRFVLRHFSDEKIIELELFCAETNGVGKFVKSLNVVSWEEACELDPRLNLTQVAAE
jgi:hypothetical protein